MMLDEHVVGAANTQQERTILRFGAVSAVLGGVLAVVGNVLHPRPEGDVTLGDAPGYAREVMGAGNLWPFAHLDLMVVSVLFLFFWVSLTRALPPGRARAIASFGLVLAVVETIIHLVTLILDGPVMYAAAYALDPSEAGQVAAFRALYHLLFGLFAGWQMLWGLTFVLFGVALVVSRSWPTWVGLIPVTGGALITVIGVVDAYRGITTFTFLVAFPVLAASLSVWVIGLGVWLWRRAAVDAPKPLGPAQPAADQRSDRAIRVPVPAQRPVPEGVGRAGYLRIGAVGGIVFVVGLLASIVVVPPGPRADASATAIVHYFVTERGAVLTAGFLTSIAALGYLMFIAAVLGRLQDADPNERVLPAAIAVATAIQVSMVIVSSVCFWALAGRLAAEAEPSVSLSVFVLGIKVYSALDIGAPIVFAALGLAVLRTHFLPRWSGQLILVLALPAAGLGLLGPLVSSGPFAPQGPVDMVATLGFLAWILVASVHLLRSASGPGPADYAPTVSPGSSQVRGKAPVGEAGRLQGS